MTLPNRYVKGGKPPGQKVGFWGSGTRRPRPELAGRKAILVRHIPLWGGCHPVSLSNITTWREMFAVLRVWVVGNALLLGMVERYALDIPRPPTDSPLPPLGCNS